jgi:hypothetical protein
MCHLIDPKIITTKTENFNQSNFIAVKEARDLNIRPLGPIAVAAEVFRWKKF